MEKDLLTEIREDYANPKKKKQKPIYIKKHKGDNIHIVNTFILIAIALIIIGVATVTKKVADWGAGHQFVWQWDKVIQVKTALPWRVEERKEIVIQPIVEKVATEELTPIEQKIVDRFGFKAGVVALAIFDCGESGLDQYAVSHTGDLGIAQINWRTWKKAVEDKFGYNAGDMFDVDKNLEVAEWIYNRDGVKDNGDESWEPWSGFTNGSYTRCFN